MRAARYDLRVDRYVPFVQNFDLEGYDLNAAGVNPYLAAQVRWARDAGQEVAGGPAAPPLLNLPLVTDDSTGLRIMGVRAENGVPTTTIRLYIEQQKVAALPLPGERGSDLTLAWDMQFSTDQIIKGYLLFGDFILVARATYL